MGLSCEVLGTYPEDALRPVHFAAMSDRYQSSQSSDLPGVSAVAVAAVCGSEILALAGYSIVPAILPQLMNAWSLTSAQAGWLAGMVFAGYMVGVLPLVGLTDRVPARTIYLASSGLNAFSCFGFALSENLALALGFRALAGVALAGMYMPGLRALTDAIGGTKRARIAAFYTSSFTIGAALSFLLGRAGTPWGGRGAFIVAGVLGVAGVLIAWMALPDHGLKPPAHGDHSSTSGRSLGIATLLSSSAVMPRQSGVQWD
jgi:MFS family permease